jgi:hypothetical protein
MWIDRAAVEAKNYNPFLQTASRVPYWHDVVIKCLEWCRRRRSHWRFVSLFLSSFFFILWWILMCMYVSWGGGGLRKVIKRSNPEIRQGDS